MVELDAEDIAIIERIIRRCDNIAEMVDKTIQSDGSWI
jgi:hypothetical protein